MSAATMMDLRTEPVRMPTTQIPLPWYATRVLLESPLTARNHRGSGLNQLYGRAALRDSLLRGEAPMAAHLLYAQTFVLDGADPSERQLGMEAGWAWLPFVDRVAVYVDRGISPGMKEGIARAVGYGLIIEERSIPDWQRG